LRALAALVTLQNLVATAGQSLLVLYAQDLLGLDAVGYGLLISVGAFGGMLGGVAAEYFAKRYGTGRIIIFETLLTGFAFVVLGVTHVLPIVMLMLAINSFSFIIGSTLILSLRQTLIPDDLLGRVTAVYRFIVIGAAPIGSLLGGVIARKYGLPTPYWVGGVIILVATLFTYPFINNEAVRIARQGAPGGK
jgi:predicted MFS family arabinose efflux permease